MASHLFSTGHRLLDVVDEPEPALAVLVHRPMGTQD
jgi:hypothetical protein